MKDEIASLVANEDENPTGGMGICKLLFVFNLF